MCVQTVHQCKEGPCIKICGHITTTRTTCTAVHVEKEIRKLSYSLAIKLSGRNNTPWGLGWPPGGWVAAGFLFPWKK